MNFFLDIPFSSSNFEGKSYTKLYIKSTTKVREMVLDYSFLSMVAEIGGYTGLLLGVSVVNMTKILEKLLARLFHV